MKSIQSYVYWLMAFWPLLLHGIQDPLPSWNDGPAKQAILNFVRTTTDPSNKNYVQPADRIATFDQDGTTWVEHPLYTEAIFAIDRIKKLSDKHPEWKTTEPFKDFLSVDFNAMAALPEHDWAVLIGITHSGMNTNVFKNIVKQWLATAKHPRFQKPYTELIYLPMLEVMQLLRANGYKTYIVTGGGQDFVRVYSDQVYGIPCEQIIGSSMVTSYKYNDGQPQLIKEPKVFLVDNFDGKPVGIHLFIGKRPYATFGNSDGDREMLEWTQGGDGLRLMMLVHHDDAEREYAYGPAGGLPNTKVGTFSDSLMKEAKDKGWIVISMKNDWNRIFSFENPATK